MKIYTNLSALNTSRMANRNQSSISTALQRLSSGARINSAKDDAAGLAISERMSSQTRGLTQGIRNVNDGISMLQTAEGAMAEVGNMLQRMRELAVQGANTGVLSFSDRKALQEEVKQLRAEVDRIAKTTNFNGVSLLNGGAKLNNLDGASDEVLVVNGLQKAWLEQAAQRISTYYGLNASNRDLTVDLTSFTDGVSNTLAMVSAGVAAGVGNVTNLTLKIDMADFTNATLPNGGSNPALYYDRIIAHEMVHALMFDQTDTSILSNWFKEGAAELIHGADERVVGDGGVAAVMGQNLSAWGGTSPDYSKAYLAARYLHEKAGGYTPGSPASSGMGQIMDLLNSGASFDAAISAAAGYANEAAFLADFDANGAAFLAANGLDLTNTDTGAIGGFDADLGAMLSPEDVIPDGEIGSANPTNFNVIWPFELFDNRGPTEMTTLQIGANEGEVLRIGTVSASATALGIKDIDIAAEAQEAIVKLDSALDFLNEQRATLGAQQNRLEAAIRVSEVNVESLSAARSRIQDADYAVETSEMTRSLIIAQASTAMLSQAQTTPQLALQLLNGL